MTSMIDCNFDGFTQPESSFVGFNQPESNHFRPSNYQNVQQNDQLSYQQSNQFFNAQKVSQPCATQIVTQNNGAQTQLTAQSYDTLSPTAIQGTQVQNNQNLDFLSDSSKTSDENFASLEEQLFGTKAAKELQNKGASFCSPSSMTPKSCGTQPKISCQYEASSAGLSRTPPEFNQPCMSFQAPTASLSPEGIHPGSKPHAVDIFGNNNGLMNQGTFDMFDSGVPTADFSNMALSSNFNPSMNANNNTLAANHMTFNQPTTSTFNVQNNNFMQSYNPKPMTSNFMPQNGFKAPHDPNLIPVHKVKEEPGFNFPGQSVTINQQYSNVPTSNVGVFPSQPQNFSCPPAMNSVASPMMTSQSSLLPRNGMPSQNRLTTQKVFPYSRSYPNYPVARSS